MTAKLSILFKPEGDNPLAAVGLLLTGVFILAFQDSLVKLISSYTSYWQFQTLRSLGNMMICIMLAVVSGHLMLLRPVNTGAVYLRATFLSITMFCFFSGAPFLSIAQMAAGLYTYPVFVTILATPILGEKVGVWRATAVLIGAIGAAIVLAPWTEDFSFIQLLPLAAGFFYACNILTLRHSCRGESPLALAFAVAVMMALSGLGGVTYLSLNPLSIETQLNFSFIAIGWPELTFTVLGLALAASVLNLAGNICMSRAYQTADASLLAPLDFVYLVFIAIWSRVLFDQWPTGQALLGMALIAGAGALTAWREQVNRRKPGN